jgi:exonuclease III
MTSVLFVLLAVGAFVVPSSCTPPGFSCVSWNVNSFEKLRCARHELEILASFDIVLLQETYAGAPEDVLNLDGFIPHHQLARPTLRRAQWGVSTLSRIASFTGGVIRRIPSPVDWMVISRWRHETDLGLLVVNVYLPMHSDGFSPQDIQTALAFIASIRNDFPADGLILGGDLNVDRWRTAVQQNQNAVISTSTWLVPYAY